MAKGKKAASKAETAVVPKAPSSLKKKYSHKEKRDYVLQHLGLITRDSMAKTLDCSVTQIYNIIVKLREDRDKLITQDMCDVIAEEQFNRLNANAKLAFEEILKERKRVKDLREYNHRRMAKDLDVVAVDTKELTNLFYMYGTAERQLTNFLKALGVYNPEIFVQQNFQDNSTTNINVTAEEVLADVRRSYGEDIALEIEAKIIEADFVDVDVTDDPLRQPKIIEKVGKTKTIKNVKKVKEAKK